MVPRNSAGVLVKHHKNKIQAVTLALVAPHSLVSVRVPDPPPPPHLPPLSFPKVR